MRILITGIGDTGLLLAEELSSRSEFELVLIDKDEEKCEALSQEIDALVIHGDGTKPAILEKAGAKEADVLIAATESDTLNMVIAILGKRFTIQKVIVKLNKLDLRTTCQEIGIDHVISPTLSATTEIINLLHGHNVLDFSLLIKEGIQLIEIMPGEMANKRVKEIEFPEKTLPIGILREGIAHIPQENTKLNENDTLLILAQDEERAEKIKEIFGELTRTRRSVELDEIKLAYSTGERHRDYLPSCRRSRTFWDRTNYPLYCISRFSRVHLLMDLRNTVSLYRSSGIRWKKTLEPAYEPRAYRCPHCNGAHIPSLCFAGVPSISSNNAPYKRIFRGYLWIYHHRPYHGRGSYTPSQSAFFSGILPVVGRYGDYHCLTRYPSQTGKGSVQTL